MFHLTFFFLVLLFDPCDPTPVTVIPNLLNPSPIKDMIIIRPSLKIGQHWPDTGRIFFLTEDTVSFQSHQNV